MLNHDNPLINISKSLQVRNGYNASHHIVFELREKGSSAKVIPKGLTIDEAEKLLEVLPELIRKAKETALEQILTGEE